MQIDPVIPGWWDGFQVSYRHGQAIYEIQVENTEHCERGVAFVEIAIQAVAGREGHQAGKGIQVSQLVESNFAIPESKSP